MQPMGFHLGLSEVFMVILFIGLPIITLIHLAKKRLSAIPLAIWALSICIVPILGSVAYWIVRPTSESQA